MKTLAILSVFILFSTASLAQQRYPQHELSINGFRNPSIGLEYRYRQVSVHAGYYLTNFESGVTTEFIRSGFSIWFLPVGKKENPSSFYASASYARGLTRDYQNKNAAMGEVGFRWMVWQGLNLRLGMVALVTKGESVKINPTPGISYSFTF